MPTIGPKTSEIFHFCQSKESRLGLNRTRQSRKKTSTLFSPPDFLPSDCAIRIFHPSENHAPNQLAKRTRSQNQNNGCKNLALWLAKTAKSRKKETFSRPARVHPSLRQLNVPNFPSARHNLMFLPEKIEDKDDTPNPNSPRSPHPPRHSRLRSASASASAPASTDLPYPIAQPSTIDDAAQAGQPCAARGRTAQRQRHHPPTASAIAVAASPEG